MLRNSPDLTDGKEAEIVCELLIKRISDPENSDSAPVLLELANCFREQARLLRRQAKELDEQAIYAGTECVIPTTASPTPDEIFSLDEKLHLSHVIHYASKTQENLATMHTIVDGIEDRLYPREKIGNIDLVPEKFRVEPGYITFRKQVHREALAAGRIINGVASGKEAAIRWKAMTSEEQKMYGKRKRQLET